MVKRKRPASTTEADSHREEIARSLTPASASSRQQQGTLEYPGRSESPSCQESERSPQQPAAVPPLVNVLPSITRKVTACVACRKNKTKCDMPENGPPCVRCRRRSLSCVLNRSLQSLLEDTKNVEHLRTDVQNLHQTIDYICQHLDIQRPRPLLISGNEQRATGESIRLDGECDAGPTEGCEVSPPESPTAVQAPIDTFLDIAKHGTPNSAKIPPGVTRANGRADLISKGIITLETAEQLLRRYYSRLDHFLYGICGENRDLDHLRKDSPTLLTAICTVSALHDPHDQETYEACNREFRSQVARSLFEKRDVEYLRALCIASFWLADASRILSSDGIRRAADMRLHRSFDSLLGAHSPEYSSPSSSSPIVAADRIRLWYLLFVCDQHLSILHNRDSLLRNDKDIAVSWEAYLHRVEATESDVRILSQVSLLLIMGQVRDVLGSDKEMQLPSALTHQISNYSRQLDRWFTRFSALFVTNAHIGEFPRRGLELHYQFGRLYLGQQVFKGLRGKPIPMHFLSAAHMAHEATVTIFEMILNDPHMSENLVGMPHYFHVMIAFAGHLLLEICHNHHVQLNIDLPGDLHLINAVLGVFRNIACITYHPLRRMAPGLNRKLSETVTMLGLGSLSENSHTGNTLSTTVQHAGITGGPGPSTQTLGSMNNIFPLGSSEAPVDDFLFTDMGEFTFPDLVSNFMP
ncbi:transcriptional regulator family: Fungal Specific TF [Aspergillus niger]|nr:transcriptional regulator family: Fungal Specific TF [Aspergillus niger]KAI2854154.1 transcriptional regulator family: Fungal Specific TF [Aspergillus niger]KAI2907970.1 transcriptional regulator family: Fungal Specific TF [Aspergillus niger]KAI2930888.1 transcriptional regulator family: Fungal Specific TF [Aspergillus niger]KAI2972141.1 transcriptional regulator family: Fungal Specific TF [Aspergillus niger]